MTLSASAILTSAPISMHRSGGIDAARGIFALWVLVFAHLIPWVIASQGADAVPAVFSSTSTILLRLFQTSGELHPAVLGFIVLSGYCIHRNGFRGDRSDLRRFAIKRSFRILPVYILALGAGILGFGIASKLNPSAAAGISGTNGIDPLCLIAKALTIPAFIPNFGACANLGNAPIGTVMVEIVLYAVYAAVFSAFVWRGLANWLTVLCVIAWVAGLIVAWAFPSIYGWWQNLSLWGFLPYWWIGAAFVSPSVVYFTRRMLPFLCLGWVLLTLALFYGTEFGAVLSEVRKLIFALVIGLLVVRLDFSHISGNNPISLIGRSGYSLYAFHAPLTYTLVIAGLAWWLIIIINIGFAMLVYAAVEKPTTRLGKALA